MCLSSLYETYTSGSSCAKSLLLCSLSADLTACECAHKGELEEHRAELPDCKLLTIGFDCEFVECPQETDAYCPICLLVLREPHQVTCCGKSYCRSCIERIELLKNQCPTCNEQKFSFLQTSASSKCFMHSVSIVRTRKRAVSGRVSWES